MSKVTIIDDEVIACDVLKDLLIINNFEVDTFTDAAEASKNLQGTDILITDLFMPEYDGFELITKIRSENSLMKIIVISGYDTYLKAAKMMGANAVFKKPFSSEELITKIKELME